MTRKSKSIPEIVSPSTSLRAWDWIRANVKTLDAVGGVKPFPDFACAQGLVEAIENHRILILAKSRQMLATWTVGAWIIQRAFTEAPGVYLLLSKGARDTGELIKRLKVMLRHLPEEYVDQAKIRKGEVVFPNDSRALALPATEDAVRMHSPAAIFWDEMAFTPHSEAIWAAVKPAVEAGGRFIGVSTPNGADNIFYQLYTDPGNGFGKRRLHWREYPGRDEEWAQQARRGLSEARWRQEYEIDFNVLTDRVYDEFDPELHLLPQPFVWSSRAGRTYRGIDFGYRHPYVIWAQLYPDGALTIFDEWEGKDDTVDEMAEAIAAIDLKHGINESNITWSACDPAGAAATDAGLSAVERLQARGIKLVWRSSEILTGVEWVKSLLKDAAGRVRLRLAPQVKHTIEHLRHYRWEPGSDHPSKDDGHDHAMDALRYLIINLFGQRKANWSPAKVSGGKW
ncbi:MAG: terminase family protein [Calditrichota bacterium]